MSRFEGFFRGEAPLLGESRFAVGDDADLLAREVRRYDGREDRRARLHGFGEAQRQRIAALGELRRGIGIGDIEGEPSHDGLREDQVHFADRFAQRIAAHGEFQQVDLMAEAERDAVAVVAFGQLAGIRDRCGDHHVVGQTGVTSLRRPVFDALHGRNFERRPRSREALGQGRDGVIGVGARRHLGNVARETGPVERLVVVVHPEGERLEGCRALRGVHGPEGDPVVGAPADRLAVVGVDLGPGAGGRGAALRAASDHDGDRAPSDCRRRLVVVRAGRGEQCRGDQVCT